MSVHETGILTAAGRHNTALGCASSSENTSCPQREASAEQQRDTLGVTAERERQPIPIRRRFCEAIICNGEVGPSVTMDCGGGDTCSRGSDGALGIAHGHMPSPRTTRDPRETNKTRRHSWSEPHRLEHETQRACWNCGILKVTRHEHNLHWIEFRYGDGNRIKCKATPPCEPASVDA